VIERVLGAGGMGLVYAAHDPDLDRRVAIKILRNDAGEEARVRLLREARAMAKLSHPNVITVYEVGSSAGVDFVAMELLEGGTLGEWLRAERRPPLEVLRRFRAAGAGLAAAHARGLVHRDFKPANVLLGRDGRVVVTDFGLARGFEHDALAETAPSPDVDRAAPAPESDGRPR
jgi:serine/threonine protein kinase